MAEERSELTEQNTGNDDSLSGTNIKGHETLARETDTVVPLNTAADGEDNTAETERLRDEIEETRTQMGATIDAIEERLNFDNITEQVTEHVNNAVETAKEAVYQATIGKATEIMKNAGNQISSSSIVKTAKENPLPFILIGAGAGLLAYKMYSGGGSGSYSARKVRTIRTSGQLEQQDQQNTGGSEPLDLTGRVSGAASGAYNRVTGAVGNVYSGAGEYVSQAYNRAADLGSTAAEQYDHYIQENPLAVAAVAIGVGAAVGFAIPATRYERQLMGSKRQELLDMAQSTASDLLDKTKDVVTEAAQTISDQTESLTEH